MIADLNSFSPYSTCESGRRVFFSAGFFWSWTQVQVEVINNTSQCGFDLCLLLLLLLLTWIFFHESCPLWPWLIACLVILIISGFECFLSHAGGLTFRQCHTMFMSTAKELQPIVCRISQSDVKESGQFCLILLFSFHSKYAKFYVYSSTKKN